MKRIAFALAAGLGASLAAQPVLAETVMVPYHDLDLATDSGIKELDRRIDNAAKQICGFSDLRTGSRLVTREARTCYKDARKQIEQKIAALAEKKVAGS